MVGELGWYHSTEQILGMAPGFLEVAKEFYQRAPPNERVAAFEKWLGAVGGLAGIVEDVRDVSPETRHLLESHAQECLNQMSRLDLPAPLVDQANHLRQLLERTSRPRTDLWSRAREPVTSGARRLAEVVANAVFKVMRWFGRVGRK